MIFRRRRGDAPEVDPAEQVADDEAGTDDSPADDAGETETETETGTGTGTDAAATGTDDTGTGRQLEELDGLDWRDQGPWDISEVDLDADPTAVARVDLGSMIVTPVPNAELRLQVAEGSQSIVSAMLVRDDSALELGAYAAPRSGGLWPELREELTASATAAGGSVSLVEGPFGVELRRLLPVQTPDGQQGYQPSRMWVVEGPRWMLRGIVYGQAALVEGTEPPVAELLTAFRNVVVRRDDQAMAPGDLLPLTLPAGVTPQ